ncbi:MAG: sugar/pyridoxal phosphate phosphatase YigL [Candidatus Dasytiphilus stammeri]
MYPIVVSDLDGTLLSADHRILPYTRKILNLLTTQGVQVILATGRHYVDVFKIRDNLGIKAYLITSNGARVHNEAGKLLLSVNLDEEIASTLYGMFFSDPDILTHVYRNDNWYLSRYSIIENGFFRESMFTGKLFEPNLLGTDGVSKIFFTCDKVNKLLLLEKILMSRWGERVNTTFSCPSCLEVMAGGVSKGDALKEVINYMGCSIKECISFGDGLNDKEMLSITGKGCIMQNAHQRLKDSLPDLEIIGSNIEQAVPRYLCKIYSLINRKLSNSKNFY